MCVHLTMSFGTTHLYSHTQDLMGRLALADIKIYCTCLPHRYLYCNFTAQLKLFLMQIGANGSRDLLAPDHDSKMHHGAGVSVCLESVKEMQQVRRRSLWAPAISYMHTQDMNLMHISRKNVLRIIKPCTSLQHSIVVDCLTHGQIVVQLEADEDSVYSPDGLKVDISKTCSPQS
jgi:hypothetical protein